MVKSPHVKVSANLHKVTKLVKKHEGIIAEKFLDQCLSESPTWKKAEEQYAKKKELTA